MTIKTGRSCLADKIADGKVDDVAGKKLIADIQRFVDDAKLRGREDIAAVAAAERAGALVARGEALRKLNQTNLQIIAQTNVLNEQLGTNKRLHDRKVKRDAPLWLNEDTDSGEFTAFSAFLAAGKGELTTVTSAHKLYEGHLGIAHSKWAEGIEQQRSQMLGFKRQVDAENAMLDAGYGRGTPEGKIAFEGYQQGNKYLTGQYIDGGGTLTPVENFVPHPIYSSLKAAARGVEKVKQIWRDAVDRDKVIDFATKERMTDERFEYLLNEAAVSLVEGKTETPTGAFRGKGSLANQRDAARLFQFKDGDAWRKVASELSEDTSPYNAFVSHMEGLARDAALIQSMGPNPDATLRLMIHQMEKSVKALARSADDFGGDVAKAEKFNRAIDSRVRSEIKNLKDLYAEVTGQNRFPVNPELAKRFSEWRQLLVGAQLGSAFLSSINDPANMVMAARVNGLPIMGLAHHTVEAFKEGEKYVAQAGMIFDTLANTARNIDKTMGDTIKSGIMARIGSAVIRASGLRRWTEAMKGGYWLNAIAYVERERVKPWADIDAKFREGMERANITEDNWKVYQQAEAYEPKPGATFLRPQDVQALGGKEAQIAADRLARYVNTMMDMAVIENDPRIRALMMGSSQPGTWEGEIRGSLGMYRSFTAGMMYQHTAHVMARGWDGSRMMHGAMTVGLLTAFGVVAMQAKEVAAGRDPLSLDLTTPQGRAAWFKAMLQGGGLGIFGDIIAVDQTKHGNSWAATFGGPQLAMLESLLGDALFKNVRLAFQGKDTHFVGDALYALPKFVPGNNLWYSKLVFQRSVLDALALWADERAPERFRRIEKTAAKEWGQEHFWSPGERGPRRMPRFGTGR